MSADSERFGLRFRREEGIPVSREDYFNAAKIFLDAVCGEPISKEEIEKVASGKIEELSGIWSIEFEQTIEYDYVEFDYGPDVYGNMMNIFDEIVNGIVQKCPGLAFELHWVEEYGGIGGMKIAYDGKNFIQAEENDANESEVDDEEEYEDDDFDFEDEDYFDFSFSYIF